MEEKRKELVRKILESVGIVVPDDVRKRFEGKHVRIVPDEEWDKVVGKQPQKDTTDDDHLNNDINAQ